MIIKLPVVAPGHYFIVQKVILCHAILIASRNFPKNIPFYGSGPPRHIVTF